MTDAFLADGVRTPVGKYGGALATVRPDDLAARILDRVVTRTGVDPAAIDDVILGAANQLGDDNHNVERMTVLLAGLPKSVSGYTVNRLCASGLQTIASPAAAIRSDDTDLMVGGGVESKTRAPWVIQKLSTARASPGEIGHSALGGQFVNPGMKELDGGEATLTLGKYTE